MHGDLVSLHLEEGGDGFTIGLSVAEPGAPKPEPTPSRINEPIFDKRRVRMATTIWDGQTIAVGLAGRGEIPNRLLFVTSRLIDPCGLPKPDSPH